MLAGRLALQSLLSVGLFGNYAISERTRVSAEVAREVETEDDEREYLRVSLTARTATVSCYRALRLTVNTHVSAWDRVADDWMRIRATYNYQATTIASRQSEYFFGTRPIALHFLVWLIVPPLRSIRSGFLSA